MTPTLETGRLWLHPLQLSDAGQIQVLFPHWEIVRFLAGRVPWPYPPDGARTYCRDIALPAAERGEEWHWTLRLKSDPSHLIGSISLMTSENHNRGFWLGLPWHGQGLMSETCDVVTGYWFGTLNFPVLRAPKAIANKASRRISVSQGMRVVASEVENSSPGVFRLRSGRSPPRSGTRAGLGSRKRGHPPQVLPSMCRVLPAPKSLYHGHFLSDVS